MVRTGLRVVAAVATLLSLGLPYASAQSILEQEQEAIAGIVRKTRGGIVSIEDAQGRLYNRESYRELRRQVAALFQKREELDAQIADLLLTLKPNHPRIVEAQKGRAAAQSEMEALLKSSEAKVDTRPILERVENDYLTALQAHLAQQETELSQLKQSLGPKHPRIVAAQQALEHTNSRLTTIQNDLDAIRRDLQAHLIHADTPKSGSGFSLGEGYIVTTADVLEGMKEPIVITDNGLRIKAELIGLDTEANVGLLRLLAKSPIPALDLGDSDRVAPGHFAISIGNQAGQPNSVALNMIAGVRSDGMYSGTHFYPSLFQIAGTIGVGTSGAPVLNARGEVIGVIAAIPIGDWSEMMMGQRGSTRGFSGGAPPPPAPSPGGVPAPQGSSGTPRPSFSGSPQNFFRPPVTSAGFAIPINAMQPVITDLRAGKPVLHSWVGMTADTIETFVVNEGVIESNRTVYVNALYPDSPAVRAGLQLGDILLQINGVPISRSVEVRLAVMRLHPGDTMILQIQRPVKDKQPESKTLEIKVAPRPPVFDKPLIRIPRKPA